MPPTAAFESDLRAVREARGTTVDQIQQQTRIPVDVLRRFEDGRLLRDETYNEVYLRAFLKSYAKAVGLSQADTLAAYDAYRAGRYDGRLHPDYVPGTEPPAPPPMPAAPSPEAPAARPAPGDPARAAASSPAPAVVALRETAPPAPRSAAPVTGTRVARPAVPGARRSFDKNWGTILGLFAGFVILLGAALWFLVFQGADAPDDAPPLAADGSETDIDSAGVGAGAAAGTPRLQLPIRVSVTAAGDGLQSFRVTADAGERRPYWINAGDTQVFEGDSALVLWGEGDTGSFAEATLELQGQRWTPPSGQPVRLDAVRGQSVLDSLARVPASVPTAPAP